MGRKQKERETVSLKEAALRMGVGYDTLRDRMRNCCLHGISVPIGFALPPFAADEQWIYVIPKVRFEMYMSGGDFSRPEEYRKRLESA